MATLGDARCHVPVLAHVDLDCFYCQVEHRRLGIPRSEPLVVRQWQSAIAVNYPARRLGIRRGDRCSAISQKFPQVHIVHVDVIRVAAEEASAAAPRAASSASSASPGCACEAPEAPPPDGPPDNRNPLERAACLALRGDKRAKVTFSDFTTGNRGSDKVSLARYRLASDEVLSLLVEQCPCVERASIDEVYLDLTSQTAELLAPFFHHLKASQAPESRGSSSLQTPESRLDACGAPEGDGAHALQTKAEPILSSPGGSAPPVADANRDCALSTAALTPPQPTLRAQSSPQAAPPLPDLQTQAVLLLAWLGGTKGGKDIREALGVFLPELLDDQAYVNLAVVPRLKAAEPPAAAPTVNSPLSATHAPAQGGEASAAASPGVWRPSEGALRASTPAASVAPYWPRECSFQAGYQTHPPDVDLFFSLFLNEVRSRGAQALELLWVLVGGVLLYRLRAAVKQRSQFTMSGAVARSKLLAKTASAQFKPDRQVLVPSALAERFLAPLDFRSLKGLRGKKGAKISQAFPHSSRVGDLLSVPLEVLKAKLGAEEAASLFSMLRGDLEGGDAVKPNLRVKSMLAFKSFPIDAGNPARLASEKGGLAQWLSGLCVELQRRTEQEFVSYRRTPKTLTVYYRTGAPQWNQISRSCPLAPASSPRAAPTLEQIEGATLAALLRLAREWGPEGLPNCSKIGIAVSDFLEDALPEATPRITQFFARKRPRESAGTPAETGAGETAPGEAEASPLQRRKRRETAEGEDGRAGAEEGLAAATVGLSEPGAGRSPFAQRGSSLSNAHMKTDLGTKEERAERPAGARESDAFASRLDSRGGETASQAEATAAPDCGLGMATPSVLGPQAEGRGDGGGGAAGEVPSAQMPQAGTAGSPAPRAAVGCALSPRKATPSRGQSRDAAADAACSEAAEGARGAREAAAAEPDAPEGLRAAGGLIGGLGRDACVADITHTEEAEDSRDGGLCAGEPDDDLDDGFPCLREGPLAVEDFPAEPRCVSLDVVCISDNSQDEMETQPCERVPASPSAAPSPPEGDARGELSREREAGDGAACEAPRPQTSERRRLISAVSPAGALPGLLGVVSSPPRPPLVEAEASLGGDFSELVDDEDSSRLPETIPVSSDSETEIALDDRGRGDEADGKAGSVCVAPAASSPASARASPSRSLSPRSTRTHAEGRLRQKTLEEAPLSRPKRREDSVLCRQCNTLVKLSDLQVHLDEHMAAFVFQETNPKCLASMASQTIAQIEASQSQRVQERLRREQQLLEEENQITLDAFIRKRLYAKKGRR
ncbi:ImpB/MucB/SamB family protein [Besnoitia besnoiti]|uniref:DNA polymerase eta n=1 Tax=Besnoitia besnoiti TaxID=94643 RepID=A0A2A9MJM1_BESBE|nr:ImpB/MucB/SamB family protein [Besnoitia besnoiti]PFH35797.1 ImpB/MucB/SamB family protein [Besnoitia besnoiti]